MKKLATILLLLFVAYAQLGYYIHSVVLREQAKESFMQKMFTKLHDSVLQVFELSAINNAIIWEEEGKEFWLNNELYDVVKTKAVAGNNYIFCLKDKQEAKVVQQLLKQQSNANENSNTNKSIRLHVTDEFVGDAGLSFSIFKLCNTSHYKLFKQVSNNNWVHELISPPPEKI